MSLYLGDFNLVACVLVRFHWIVILKQCKLLIQHMVLDNDCCISRNVARTKINLVTSDNDYPLAKKKETFSNTFLLSMYQKHSEKDDKLEENIWSVVCCN